MKELSRKSFLKSYFLSGVMFFQNLIYRLRVLKNSFYRNTAKPL